MGGYNLQTGTGAILLTEAGAAAPATVAIVDNLQATWIDISATGTALNLTDDRRSTSRRRSATRSSRPAAASAATARSASPAPAGTFGNAAVRPRTHSA